VPVIAQRALAAVGLEARTADALLAQSSVSPSTSADILTFTVADRFPGRAARLATEYAHQYIVYSQQLNTAAIGRAKREVDARIRQLEAAHNTRSALYSSLVSKSEQLGTMAALQTANAVLVRPATHAVQVQPKPVRNGILGLLLGFVLGLCFAFLRETLDTRIRSASEISSRLGLPLLGRIPAPARSTSAKNRLMILEHPYGEKSEPFRVLRTNLDFVNLEKKAKTIMITSAVSGEGKSTTAANLAIALTQSGRSVVLVDLDLRRPYIDQFFELNGQPGLTSVALGTESLDSALVRFRNRPMPEPGDAERRPRGTLDVLRAGMLPPNPGEFVSSQAVTDILAELRARADVVLIDAPPLLGVGDALALTAKVDALILVTRLNVLRRQLLSEVQVLLETAPAPALGFVVTEAESEESYGYAYFRYEGKEPHTPAEAPLRVVGQ
jgi:non-specific protein-tyrosine kinase